VTSQSTLRQLLQAVDMIIWDEVTMQHHFTFKAIDWMLRDLYQNNLLFSGVAVLLRGDWAQTLLVII
jgi:hypothetical protein